MKVNKLFVLLLWCMMLMPCKVWCAADGNTTDSINSSQSAEIDSLYAVTFDRFLNSVLDIDNLNEKVVQRYRSFTQNAIKQRVAEAFEKNARDANVVNPLKVEKTGDTPKTVNTRGEVETITFTGVEALDLIRRKMMGISENVRNQYNNEYENEVNYLAKTLADKIVGDYIETNYLRNLLDSSMKFFHEGGMTVEEMNYMMAYMENAELVKEVEDFLSVNKYFPFMNDAANFISKYYERYGKTLDMRRTGDPYPELREEYDKMFVASNSNVIFDNIMLKLTQFDTPQDSALFYTECLEAFKKRRIREYVDNKCKLNLRIIDVLSSSAYKRTSRLLSQCSKNLDEMKDDEYNMYYSSRISNMLEPNIENLWSKYMIGQKDFTTIPEKHKELNVMEAGSLGQMLSADEKGSVTHLKVSGKLDAKDMKILRAMMGASAEAKLLGIDGVLQNLDLAEATFVESDEGYHDNVLLGVTYYSSVYSTNYSSSKTFHLDNMTEKEWKAFKRSATSNIMGGDDFKLEFDGKQVHNVSILKEGIVGKELFADCLYLKEIRIPKNTKKINENAFKGCSRIEQLQLPESVKVLENHAFVMMSSLKSVLTPKEQIVVEERNDSSYRSQYQKKSEKYDEMESLFYGNDSCEGLFYINKNGKKESTNVKYKYLGL